MLDSEDTSSWLIELRNLASSKRDLQEIVEDKRLAKIGDSVLNLLNTLAKASKVVPEQSKVSNRMLKWVSEKVGLRASLRKRMKEKEIGNAVEALVAFWYIKGDFSGLELLEESKRQGRFDLALAKIIEKLAKKEGYLI